MNDFCGKYTLFRTNNHYKTTLFSPNFSYETTLFRTNMLWEGEASEDDTDADADGLTPEAVIIHVLPTIQVIHPSIREIHAPNAVTDVAIGSHTAPERRVPAQSNLAYHTRVLANHIITVHLEAAAPKAVSGIAVHKELRILAFEGEYLQRTIYGNIDRGIEKRNEIGI
jgi:hypothetical protein